MVHASKGRHKATMKDVRVAKSKIKGGGQGLFAARVLLKGTQMPYPYKGKRFTKLALANCRDVSYCMGLSTDSKYCAIDARQHLHLNPCRYINGARTALQRRSINAATVELAGKVQFITLRKVTRGEEIIVDYGSQYWILWRVNQKLSDIQKRKAMLSEQLASAKTETSRARVYGRIVDLQIKEEELLDDDVL